MHKKIQRKMCIITECIKNYLQKMKRVIISGYKICKRLPNEVDKYMNIKDIAKLAGVSTATVSRVINNSGYVKEETKKRITDIIKENDYVPNAIARSLCMQNTFNIGVIVPDISNEFFAEVIRGITETVEENALNVLLFNTDEQESREHSYLKIAESERLKGIIIAPVSAKDKVSRKELLRLEKAGVPIVLLDRDMEGVELDGVFADNFHGAYDGVKALIQEGHEKIAIITGSVTSLPGRERLRGYKEALKSFEIPIREEYIVSGDFKIDKAYVSTKELLSLDEKPTAIFTVNNLTSLGCLKYITEQGLIPGKDIAVLGYDGITTLNAIAYPFSAVERDARRQGREAVRLLLQKLTAGNENGMKQVRKVVIPYKIQLRGSEKYVK